MKTFQLLILFPFAMIAQKFDIEGHRGCRGLMPENTIEAFIHAIKYNITTLELDVCINKDGQVIVSHEPYMNSIFCSKPDGSPVLKKEEKSLNLYQMEYTEIKKYNSGSRGNALFPEQQKLDTYKPLLSEVFEKVEAYLVQNNLKKVNYNIEIKSEKEEYNISQPEVAEFSEKVYAVISKDISPERIVLQSFDFEVLKYWKLKIDKGDYKKVQLAALVEKSGAKATFESLGFLPDIFSPYFKILTKAMVKKCHRKGVKVIPWTVNKPEDMQQMKEIGTDGLITDYPDRSEKLFGN
jgi:glycerophosphoryl diester phosphodiesterase